MNPIFDLLPLRVRVLIFRLASFIPVVARRRKLLIVRLDAIGDYVLFRNMLQAIHQNGPFRDYSITLLGNILWKDMAEAFDRPYLSRFIFINPDILYNRERYASDRFFLMLKLKFAGFSQVIHPVHSRMSEIDFFISDLGIPERIASMGDDINCPGETKKAADALYTQLIPIPGPDTFEFIRNREFARRLLQDDSLDLPLSLPVNPGHSTGNMVTIVPGAGHAFRQWPSAHFAELISRLSNMYPETEFCLLGSGADIGIVQQIIDRAEGSVTRNLAGKTTLPELVNIIQRSLLVIGNDSSAIHIAAATGIPAICISNGNMFGRFNPYPAGLNKAVITVYGDRSFYDPSKFHYLAEKTRVRSEFNISDVTIDAVMAATLKVLENCKNN